MKKHRVRDEDAKRLGVPFYIGEFGACGNSDVCVEQITQVAEANDLFMTAGWAVKNFPDAQGFYNFDGSLQQNKVRAIARPYVKAAQGRITKMKVERD